MSSQPRNSSVPRARSIPTRDLPFDHMSAVESVTDAVMLKVCTSVKLRREQYKKLEGELKTLFHAVLP